MSNEAGMSTHVNQSDISDVLAIDSLLSAEERRVRERVRDFTNQRIRPDIAGWYEDAVFPSTLR